MDELWTDLQGCYGAMRWSRPDMNDTFEFLRAPVQTSPTSVRRRPQSMPVPPSLAPSAQASALPPPRPLLLTRRKSDAFKAAFGPEDTPTPPPARIFNPGPLAKGR
jgi:hypothetical protein